MSVFSPMIGIITSGLISYAIARCVKPQAKLKISLDPYMDLTRKLLGGGFAFKKGNKELSNVKVLKLTISTGRFSGVGNENFHSKFKPSIRLHGFNIVGFNTLNNDRTRFDIPLGQSDGNTIIVNIN